MFLRIKQSVKPLYILSFCPPFRKRETRQASAMIYYSVDARPPNIAWTAGSVEAAKVAGFSGSKIPGKLETSPVKSGRRLSNPHAQDIDR